MSRTGGPSLPIDVRIPGIGRVKRRSGVRTRSERDDLVAMLRLLPKQGYLDLVRDVQAGRRELLELYAHFTAGTLAQLQGPQDDQVLGPIADDWLEHAMCADGTRDNRRDAFRALRPDGRRTYLLRDLPELLQTYRACCEAAGHPRAFNIARTATQAFVRDKVGKRKPLALAVADVAPLKERKRGREGLPIADAIVVRDQLGGAAARIWWSMCLTGMGPKEYFTDVWEVRADRVHIEGAKAEGRRRDVPLVDYPVRPDLTRDGFTSALRHLSKRRLVVQLRASLDRDPSADELAAAVAGTAAGASGTWKVTPYQARKTFARWMEDAGIPRARREVYRGHGKRDIGDVYERYEVTDYLREDAERMRAQLGPQKLALAR